MLDHKQHVTTLLLARVPSSMTCMFINRHRRQPLPSRLESCMASSLCLDWVVGARQGGQGGGPGKARQGGLAGMLGRARQGGWAGRPAGPDRDRAGRLAGSDREARQRGQQGNTPYTLRTAVLIDGRQSCRRFKGLRSHPMTPSEALFVLFV